MKSIFTYTLLCILQCVIFQDLAFSQTDFTGIIASHSFEENTNQGSGTVLFDNFQGDDIFDFDSLSAAGSSVTVEPGVSDEIINGAAVNPINSFGFGYEISNSVSGKTFPANISTTDSLSAAVWMKFNGDTATIDDNRNHYGLQLVNGSGEYIVRFGLRNDAFDVKGLVLQSDIINNGGNFFRFITDDQWTDGNWHHYLVSMINNGAGQNVITIYVDGISVISYNTGGENSVGGFNSDINRIAVGLNGSSIDASVDELRVAKREFTSTEISQLSTISSSVLLNSESAEQIEDQVQVYPNPVTNNFFRLNESLQGESFTINSINGTQMMNGVYQGSEINTSSLEAGIYFLSLNNKSNTERVKLIIR